MESEESGFSEGDWIYGANAGYFQGSYADREQPDAFSTHYEWPDIPGLDAIPILCGRFLFCGSGNQTERVAKFIFGAGIEEFYGRHI